MRRLIRTLVFSFSLILVIGCESEQPEDAAESNNATAPEVAAAPPATGTASEVGDQMPRYTANELGGGTWELADVDGVTMLNLWATWCGPCRYEIPALIQLQKEYGDKGLHVVGVSMDQAGMESQIESFARNAGINYKIVHDPQARLADVLDTTIIPTTALIDRSGKVVWYHAGIVSDDDPKLIEALEAALATDQASVTVPQS
ncbi:MAG: TlpA family protein disulfide reductase [Acidobacteria bacterium]|nr:TlpA family protein disulfide reductase [Acidobacteriota bacterium]